MTASHAWLLGEDIEVAGRLLLPLAGPDTFTEEENDSLPLDLQYLPDDKTREPDPEIRKLLLEALMQVGNGEGNFMASEVIVIRKSIKKGQHCTHQVQRCFCI